MKAAKSLTDFRNKDGRSELMKYMRMEAAKKQKNAPSNSIQFKTAYLRQFP